MKPLTTVLGVLLMTLQFGAGPATRPIEDISLDFDTPVDAELQRQIEQIDLKLREMYAMTESDSAVGVVDLRNGRVALLRPDRIEYAASVPKIGILLAYFATHPEAATKLDPQTRKELGEMIKVSSNEMAAKYSREIGLKKIQEVIESYGLYDKSHGGGIWVGKHYGKDKERYGDPVGDNSHGATVRQVLRFYLLMEQGKLVSPEASATMMEIFASPDIPHDQIKFVKGLAGRDLQIMRKSGTWKEWLHDTADISGQDRHYILVALTCHPQGDEYLEKLAPAVDDVMGGR